MHIIDQDDLGELPDVYAAAECRFLYAAEDGAEQVVPVTVNIVFSSKP